MDPSDGIGSPGIIRSGNPEVGYTYSVASGYQNFPVTEVSWGDAARFCNWLANGQPDTGVENSTTTEDGSYALNGDLTDKALNLVTRSPNATYVIPQRMSRIKQRILTDRSIHLVSHGQRHDPK